MVITVSLLLYLVLQIFIGYWVSRKIATQDDYFLAGRSLGLFMASFSIFATWFGAETCIGSSGAVFTGGLSSSRAEPFGYTLCLILMSLFLASQLWKKNVVTLADLYKTRYNARVEKLAAFLLVPTSVIWASAQIRAFGEILSVLIPIPAQMCILIAGAFVILYTFSGGMMGDVIHDVVQGSIIIIGLAVMLYYVIDHSGGAAKAFSSIDPKFLSFKAEGESWLSRLDTWMVPVLGSLFTQELVSRVMSSKCPNTAKRASMSAAALYFFVGMIPVTLGLLGKNVVGPLEHGDQFLPQLAKKMLPEFGFVLFSGALVAAILSTVDSALLSAGAFLSRNVFGDALAKYPEKKKVLYSRSLIAICGVAATLIALFSGSIYGLVIAASSVGAAGVLVVTLFALWSPGFGSSLAAGSTLVIGMVATPFYSHIVGSEAPFVFSVLTALFTFVSVTYAEKWLRKPVLSQEPPAVEFNLQPAESLLFMEPQVLEPGRSTFRDAEIR